MTGIVSQSPDSGDEADFHKLKELAQDPALSGAAFRLDGGGIPRASKSPS